MAERIRVKHITNSLYQMEQWCRYLRVVLYKMDPNTSVSTSDSIDIEPDGEGILVKRPVLAMGCPPPVREPDCPPDDDDKDHGKGKGKHKTKGKPKPKTKR